MDAEEKTPPPVLYHYTTAPGLAGIITPTSWNVNHPAVEVYLQGAAQLQASDVRFMNDSQELLFGASIFERRFRLAAANPAVPENIKWLVGQLADALHNRDPFDWGRWRIFAACFCESGDLLSQWRGYAGGVGGFALGFTRDALEKHSYVLRPGANWAEPTPGVLRPVIYGDEDGDAAADHFIKWLQTPDSQPELLRTSINDRRVAVWITLLYVFREIAVLKHKAFSEEREWRLFYSGELEWPARMRARVSGLVPYLDFAVNAVKTTAAMKRGLTEAEFKADAEGDTEVMPKVRAEVDQMAKDYGPSPTVAQIVVGPGPDQPGQVAAARELVKISWNDPNVVVPSKAPFRG